MITEGFPKKSLNFIALPWLPQRGRGTAAAVDEEITYKYIKIYTYNKKTHTNTQNLRKNMIAEDKHLWYNLQKKLPVTVRGYIQSSRAQRVAVGF